MSIFLFSSTKFLVGQKVNLKCNPVIGRTSRLLILLTQIQFASSSIGLPVDGREPLNISLSMIIEDVNSLNALTMDFRLEFFLAQEWNVTNQHCQSYRQLLSRSLSNGETIDLNGEPIVLKDTDVAFLWIPDTFMYNAKQVGPTTYDSSYKSLILRFYGPDQCSFSYSLRLSATIPCPMNFRWFPADKQVCRVSIRSGSYSSDKVRFSWLPSGVILESKVSLLQHTLAFSYSSMESNVHDQTTYSWLVIDLTFRRIMSYHIIQIYLPTIILVSISYCSLWLGTEVIAGRITLGVTTQLALITQFSGVRSRLPQVSYVNAVDIWMISCMFFVFFTILITTIVIVVHRKSKALQKEFHDLVSRSKEPRRPTRVESNWTEESNRRSSIIGNNPERRAEMNNHALHFNLVHFEATDDGSKFTDRIDWTLRIVYPSLFCLFNLFYWAIILTIA